MRKATKTDFNVLIDILTQSFNKNKSTNYILKNKQSLSKLIEYSISKGFLFGEVWISEDETSCAILIDPKKKKFSLVSIWLDIKLITQVVGLFKLKKVMKKENITQNTLPKDIDFIHLWFLGVSPKEQGKGNGSKLLEELFQYYKSKKKAMCLETSTLRNLSFYEKKGFVVYNTKNFGFDLYFYLKTL